MMCLSPREGLSGFFWGWLWAMSLRIRIQHGVHPTLTSATEKSRKQKSGLMRQTCDSDLAHDRLSRGPGRLDWSRSTLSLGLREQNPLTQFSTGRWISPSPLLVPVLWIKRTISLSPGSRCGIQAWPIRASYSSDPVVGFHNPKKTSHAHL